MIGWGAGVEASQAADVSAYLADQFGPSGPKAALAPDRIAAAGRLLTARCTVCHATDLVEAQRLDVDGWRRELAKMIGWGAVLAPGEPDLLAAYLAQRSHEGRPFSSVLRPALSCVGDGAAHADSFRGRVAHVTVICP